MLRLLEDMGAKVEKNAQNLALDTTHITHHEANYELVRTMRASVLVLGPLLARYGHARVSLPGGCAIGARPINIHLRGLQQLGAEITLEGGYIIANCKRLRGTSLRLDLPTVTGTANLMMAASLAEGRTIIENAAREPEVSELAHYINKMGGKISGIGSNLLVIDGVDQLNPVDYSVMSDRIEAGTLLVAGAITGGDVLLKRCPVHAMEAVIDKICATGASISYEADDAIRIRGTQPIRSVDVRTQPYPGFPTDMQAQFMSLMAVADGRAAISETIFENRFMHVSELRRMGADIICEGSMAIVRGKNRLQGAPVMATDLRASACLVLAGLVADGVTEIRRIYHLDRGYDQIEIKLQKLGARIQRITS
jgi:UDP-N-acetylglucosamine 1-carboxyvinyltransferase